MCNITIGTDPELFALNDKSQFISGHDLIPGTKMFPHPVPYGAIQVDGVALEFNIEPASNRDEFTKSIRAVMNSVEEYVKNYNPDYSLVTVPTAYFEKEYFESLPEDVKVLGCTPDFDAYTGQENETPHTEETFRTGAGHIHIGWGQEFSIVSDSHLNVCRELVKELDSTLYPSSLLWDEDDKRRTLYGKIGSFRPKSYGLEYRPLSNAYLKDKKTQEFVFDMTKYVSERFFSEKSKIYSDHMAQRFTEDILLGRSISRRGVESYLKYIGDSYGTPIYQG